MTPMANARFILGDPATDGLEFLISTRPPRRRHGPVWRAVAFVAILLATLGAVLALDAAGVTLPVAAEGTGPQLPAPARPAGPAGQVAGQGAAR